MDGERNWSEEALDLALRHESKLRSLARALLSDPAEQDEVVQETLVRVASHPPRHAAALPSFLRTVFRNFLRERLRREGRRRFHEGRVVGASDLPSPEDVLERETIRGLVLEAVFRLEEPYRSTVIWLYLEEMTPAEISKKLGIGASTVRSRSQRALAQLRQRLEGRFGARGMDWRAALLPVLSKGATSSSLVATLEGALMMKKILLIGAAALLVVAIGILFEMRDGGSLAARERVAANPLPSSSPDSNAPIVVAATSTATRDLVEEDRAGARASVEFEQVSAFTAASTCGGYRGRLVNARGDAIPLGTVTVLEFDRRLSPTTIVTGDDAGMREVTVTCDAKGRFEVAPLRTLARHLIVCEGGNDGFVSRSTEREPAAGEVVDLGDIRLVARGSASGRVIDEEGQPVAGARVVALPPAVDGQGLGTILWGVALEFLAPETRFAIERKEGESIGYDVVDVPPPVKALVASLRLPIAITAADGTFTVRGLEAIGTRILASKPGLLAAVKTKVDGTKANDVGDLKMGRGHRLTGRIVDEKGRGIEGAEWIVGPTSTAERTYHALIPGGTSRADGAFACDGLPDRELLVAARKSADDPWIVSKPARVGREAVIVLPTSVPATFDIERRDGAAIADLRVDAFRGHPTGEVLALELVKPRKLEIASDSSHPHRYVARDLPGGAWLLRVRSNGTAPVLVSVDHPTIEPVHIVLDRGVDLSAIVVDANAKPVLGAEVELRSKTPNEYDKSLLSEQLNLPHAEVLALARTTSDVNGRFRIESLSIGAYEVVVRHPSFSDHVEAIEVDESVASRTIRLAQRTRVEGIVQNGGKPVESKRRLRVESSVRRGKPSPVVAFYDTDDRGAFSIEGLAPGDYSLSSEIAQVDKSALLAMNDVLSHAITWAGSTQFSLIEGGKIFVYHEEDPYFAAPDEEAMSISGVVTFDGQPVADCSIEAKNFEQGIVSGRRSWKTDSQGKYRIDRFVAPKSERGQISLDAHSKDPAFRVSRILDHVTKPEMRADFVLQSAKLSGTVKAPDGKPRKCKVNLMGLLECGGRASELTDTNDAGEFTFERLLTGTYDIQSFSQEGNSTERGVVLHGGANRVELVMYSVNDVGGKVNLAAIPHAEDSLVTAVLFMQPTLMNYWPNASVGDDGSFRFDDVFPETYEIRFIADGKWYRSSSPVTVKANAIEGLLVDPVPCDPPDYLMPKFPAKK